jgi:hypothetical protein
MTAAASLADAPARNLLRALRTPAAMLELAHDDLTDLLDRARSADVLGRLAARSRRAGIDGDLPAGIAGLFEAVATAASTFQRMVTFEANRIERALRGIDVDIVVLKGGAYVLAQLPPADGRALSDLDLLVPRDRLDAVEARLLDSGWESAKSSAYDQHFYRVMSHELPPLRHATRRTYVDLHHAILPPTGRLHPDPRLLLAQARPIQGWARFKALAPSDMVLHTSVHLFQDGELRHGLREIIDLDDLLRHFGTDEEFWPTLIDRAARLDCRRPLHYALRYAAALLGTPIPDATQRAASTWAPPAPFARAMDVAIANCLAASGRPHATLAIDGLRRALYIRSHWLRMPPLMLARHLLRKSMMRLRPDVAQS